MTLDQIRNFATSLPHVTEKVQWGDDLIFKVGGKMFCVAYLGVPTHLSFRPSEEHRLDLLEIEGVIPAPYMARAGWVSVREMKAVGAAEIRTGIRASYDYYFAKLPKKTQAALAAKISLLGGGRADLRSAPRRPKVGTSTNRRSS